MSAQYIIFNKFIADLEVFEKLYVIMFELCKGDVSRYCFGLFALFARMWVTVSDGLLYSPGCGCILIVSLNNSLMERGENFLTVYIKKKKNRVINFIDVNYGGHCVQTRTCAIWLQTCLEDQQTK